MKLQDTRQCYQDNSGRASEIARQLAFAALGIVWIFKVDRSDGGMEVSQQLLWPAAWAIMALALDLLQYVYATVAWGVFNRLREHSTELNEETEFHAPPLINWPTIALFWLKLIAISACYVLLLRYMVVAIFWK
jgi:hypothetical protein